MPPEQPQEIETREQRLEAALRVIQTWADCWHPSFESPHKAMKDIAAKCREALTTGEGE